MSRICALVQCCFLCLATATSRCGNGGPDSCPAHDQFTVGLVVLQQKTREDRLAFNYDSLADDLGAEAHRGHIARKHKELQKLSRKPGTCTSLPSHFPKGTNCPKPSWVAAMVEADPSPNKVIMDVGCNKGNDVMLWMERFDSARSRFWSASRWVSHIKNTLNVQHWACPPETFVPSRAATSSDRHPEASHLTGVCIEPMQANLNILRNATKELGYENNTNFGSLRVVQAALANPVTDEIAMFPNGAEGQENIGLTDNAPNKVPVKLSTVDRMVSDLKLPRVDILTVDTEGADPLVILGANSTLASVRYLTFEVHRDLQGTAWNTTTLQSVITLLHEHGFDCYWAGNEGDLLSINNCWFNTYEQGTWANVACAKSDDVWGRVLAAHQTQCCCPTHCQDNAQQTCWEACASPMPTR